MEVPRLRVELELQLPAYTTAHGNAGSLTHGARPGIEPVSSWMLVRFVSTEPRQELHTVVLLCIPLLPNGDEHLIHFLAIQVSSFFLLFLSFCLYLSCSHGIWRFLWSTNSTPGYRSEKIKTLIQKYVCTPIFRAATITTIEKQPKCSSIDTWIKKMWCRSSLCGSVISNPTSIHEDTG